MFGRRKIAALVAEFLGTGFLTLLILSVQRSTIGVPFFVAAAAGLTVIAMVLAFYRVSGAHFNPALTLALFTARKVTFIRTLVYVLVQIAGAYAAYLLYSYFVHNKLQDIGGKFAWRVFTAEAVGTGLLAFGYAAALYQRFTVGVAAAGAGVAYMLGSIAASSASVGLINPAVAYGVKAATLAYLLGPVAGALVGVNLYKLLFAAPEGAVDGGASELDQLQSRVGADAEVTQTTVTTVKPARKPRAATTKSRTTAKRAPRK
ncbi:MAG: aquaporin [Patescibacteria group bacterium]|nr:aquaporin [Patescibacteria group bacterium]